MRPLSRTFGVRGSILVPMAAGFIAAGSVAWACTPIMGIGTITGTRTTSTGVQAGPRGSTVVMDVARLKSRTPATSLPNQPLASPATFRILFYDNASLAAKGDRCMTDGFVMKRADGTGKANNVAAVPNGDRDQWGNEGAFTVRVKVPTYFPGTTTKIPLGKSKICGMEQTPDLNQTGTQHFTFKVTMT